MIAIFRKLLLERAEMLTTDSQLHKNFIHEMRRFLPPDIVRDTVDQDTFWIYLTGLIQEETHTLLSNKDIHDTIKTFKM